MNTISGKVMLKESGVGLPDLLVGVYDIRDGAQVETVLITLGPAYHLLDEAMKKEAT